MSLDEWKFLKGKWKASSVEEDAFGARAPIWVGFIPDSTGIEQGV